ncbi:phosphoribosylglycinamide formyltransferase [Oceanicella actignis]|uniref:phosphoribosylglycinamide formyltransferase n=1 Tax=Oceanicella actignis TaxID=1189325 RepID=UPI0011E6105B|nr:phosphoribosylglycinamide formyltransferase [Oceanicella actignis]TYO90022.1 phosphoribosylglycinamide formyltransferase-1 [Oceanicella actignis]
MSAQARRRVAILISGTGSNMEALLASMDPAVDPEHPATPVLVLSNDPRAAGLAKAAARGVPALAVDHKPYRGDRAAFEAALHAALEEAGAELICLAGFMRILTPAFVARWQGRMLNIHPSLLPRHKGLRTHERALEAGDAEHGCTVHEVTAELDDGPILGQARTPILPGDTPDLLAARVRRLEHRLYPLVLRRFAAGDRTPVMLQDD